MSDEGWSVLGDRASWTQDDTGEWVRETATRRRDRRMLVWLVVLVLLVVAVLYGAGWAWASDRLPRGTTIAGVDVGGLRTQRAEAVLEAAVRQREAVPITVVVDDQAFQVRPDQAGLDVDVPASVAQVPTGRSLDPTHLWQSVVGGSDHPAVVVTIDDLLRRRLGEVARRVDRPAVDGAVRFTTEGAEPVYPRSGEELDLVAAARAVRSVFLTSSPEVDLDLRPVAPDVGPRAVSTAMKRFANPATSAPVTFRFGAAREVVVRPEDLPGVLSMRTRQGRLVPRLDEDAFTALVGPRVAGWERAPRDAVIVEHHHKARVVPAKQGRTVDVGAMADAFLTLLTAQGEERTVTMTMRPVEPRVSTAQAERRLERQQERDATQQGRN